MDGTCRSASHEPRRRWRDGVPLDDLRPALPRRDDQLRRSAGDRHPEADAAGANSAGARSTTATSSSRSSSPTRSASCSPDRIIDRLGTKSGFALALIVWSLAAMATPRKRRAFGPATSVVARRASGWHTRRRSPASSSCASCSASASRATSRRRSRPSRNGSRAASARSRPALFNAGTNIGADHHADDRAVHHACSSAGAWAFIVTGAARLRLAGRLVAAASTSGRIGIRALSAAGAARYIRSDPPETDGARAVGAACCGYRQTWAFAIAKFMTDPIWWLYLFWMPDFFSRTYGLSLLQLGPPIIVIYLVADVGSVGGGWLSSTLIRRGWTRERRAQDRDARSARSRSCRSSPRRACRACGRRSRCISLATAAHQGWSANVVHAGVGHVSAAGGRLGRRPGRVCRRGRRDDDREGDRLPAADDRQLRDGVA